jgi:hypothetical protein
MAALTPAAPAAELRQRVARAVAAPAALPARGRWLAERLLWACGGAAAGALAASLAFAVRPAAPERPGAAAAGPAVVVAMAGPPVEITEEEEVAWTDAGVQYVNERTPARVLRRVAIERHRPAGGAEYRVSREDIILLPVSIL